MAHRLSKSYNRLDGGDGLPGASTSNMDYERDGKFANVATDYSHATFAPPIIGEGPGQPASRTFMPRFRVWLTRLRVWREDLLGLVVAMLAFLAILITLGVHDGLTLPHWPFGISINALVAVFSTLFKMALAVPVAGAVSQLKWDWFAEKPRPLADMVVFDKVSRGNIWHAGKLVAIQQGRHWASLGAVLFFLLIGTDPFFQQIIKYEPCFQTYPVGSATIARVNNYSTQGIHTGAGLASLDAPMQAAIYKGVYNATSPVAPICATGNCTYPEFRTTGFCHGCEDVTDLISFKNLTGKNDTSTFYTEIWSLPNASAIIGLPYPVVLNMSSQLYRHHINFDLKGEGSDEVLMVRTDIIRFEDFYETGVDFNPKVKAQSCWLQPCVRTYNLTVNSTIPHEQLISTESMKHPDEYSPFAPWTAAPMPCYRNNSVTVYPSTDTVQSDETPHPVYGVLPNNQTLWVPDDCFFSFGAGLGLSEYIGPLLNGNVSAAPEDDATYPDYMAQLCYTGNCNYSSIDGFWGTLADSITTRIRTFGDPGTDYPGQGQMMDLQTCIAVHWPWLAFPAVLLVLTSLLFAATAMLSITHMARRLWKDSPLALLHLHLDGEIQDRVHSTDSRIQMERVSKRAQVQLCEGQSGTVLREGAAGQSHDVDPIHKSAVEMDRL